MELGARSCTLLEVIVKGLNLLFALAFLMAAVVQLNDPDPWLWVPAYLVALSACVAFQRRRLDRRFALAIGAVALLWGCTLVPTVVRQPPALADIIGGVKMVAPGVEEAREMGGLGLIAGWMLTLAAVSHRGARRHGRPESGAATLR